ncbi:MAG: class I SAM-dependent methyltransferase, partial [Chloroflexota bacterium]
MPSTNPFDALKPFKSQLGEFSPRDTLPWDQMAANLVQGDQLDTTLGCIHPPVVVRQNVDWLVNHLNLSPQAAILDIGCGPGLYSQALAEHGYNVTGIDIAEPFLLYARAQAEQQNLPITYLNHSMFDLNFVVAFDLILLVNSMLKQLTLPE